MKKLLAILILVAACEPAPTVDQACRDACTNYMVSCGFMEARECRRELCSEEFGPCEDDMRDYFVCIQELRCYEDPRQCRATIRLECGGWL
jgi:hypothetical protein